MKLTDWLGMERGRAAALAARLNIKPPQVSDWGTGKKQVPIDHCVAIERFTGREVSCEEMRPDKAEDFAYLRGLVEEIQPNQAPALTPPAQAAITVIADGAQAKSAASAQHAPANAAPGAASPVLTGEAV